MRRVLCAALTMAILGCKHPVPVTVAAKPATPCAPNVAEEMHRLVRPTITLKAQDTNASWSETHTVRCPENMRTVLPSSREGVKANSDDYSRWFDEHEYCIPDGLGK